MRCVDGGGGCAYAAGVRCSYGRRPLQRIARGGIALAMAAIAAGSMGCAELPANVPRAEGFDARQLSGGWHVLASNFPMWLEGNKSEPNFIYRVLPGEEPVRLDDIVAYTESGRRETIEGTDTQDPQSPAHFTWRGKGLLAAFSSDWVVVARGPEDRWLVLYFTKTLATPEGVDVIARTPELSPEDRESVEKLLANHSFLKEKSKGILWLGRARPVGR
ncbi:MAG: hypothetical protein R3B70_01040 [Polyangiaceae bacterium]